MATLSHTAQGMNGVILVGFRVGASIVGQPLREKSYTSELYPDGLRRSELKTSSRSVQRVTAMIWLYNNLVLHRASRPYGSGAYGRGVYGSSAYDVSGGYDVQGSYGDDQLALGDDATQTPDGDEDELVSAATVLTREFGGVLADDLIKEMGLECPGVWTWKDFSILTGSDAPILEQLAEHATAASSAVRQQASLGSYGHNSGEAPLSAAHIESIVQSLEVIADVARKCRHPNELSAAKETVQQGANSIGRWAVGALAFAAVQVPLGALQEMGKDLYGLIKSAIGWISIVDMIEGVLRLLDILPP